MPAGYAHYTFGQKVLEKLNDEKKKIILNHLDLYNIGVHGPDILFYHKALKKNKISTLGSYIHREEANIFFKHAKEVIKESKDKEASLAYIYGFITHFALDRACHNYVDEVEREKNITHLEIESELDRAILISEGHNPITRSLTKHIHLNHYISRIIAPFFDLKEDNIYKALKDLLFYLGLIKAPSKLKRKLVLTGMKIGGIYESHKGLMINYKQNEKAIESTNELLKRLDDNINIAVMLIEEFHKEELNDIYHYNFE